MAEQKLILSLTSYPARIRYVPQVLTSLLSQTHPADAVMLYLSEEQFPNREKELPPELQSASERKQVQIRWVNTDLKPHKKYIYAFREFPEDLVVTVDDDVLYEPAFLEILLKTHQEYPDAVVAGRTHLITLDDSGQPYPYRSWLRQTLGFEAGPSMQLFAVGIGGVLYHPRWFPAELYNEEIIRRTCLMADDLWLKTMELVAGIPVVYSPAGQYLRIIPGSQEVSLYQQNVYQDLNDESLSAIRAWADSYYGKDLLAEALSTTALPVIRDELSLLAYLNTERKALLKAMNDTRRKLRVSEKEKSRQKEEIDRLGREKAAAQQEAELLRASSSYRVGSTLLKPIHLLRRKK